MSVDIGGTFTDLLITSGNKIIAALKVSTTPGNPEKGVMEAIRKSGIKRFEEMVHATTIGTNTLLGQYGLDIPKIALITTKGFSDVIEIGRQNRPSLYDLRFQRPRTLVVRKHRYEVTERTNVSGKIEQPLNKEDLIRIVDRLKKESIRSVAVSFLHSYLNPKNEKEAYELIKDYVPYVTLSSSIAPEPREFERTSTSVVNAVLTPVFVQYLKTLKDDISTYGNPSMSVMSNSGGLISHEEAMSKPVAVIESGPAAGVIASNEFAKQVGITDLISFDMGGTTAKAGTVLNNTIEITTEYEVGGSSLQWIMAPSC
ncbi:hydantoinase/oxoprolinase family protein [Thermoplasmatales archaeon AK]|nr:hydantoinase/oxoprolinase family protein [Thermoplasmatales archaeon AK]